jgi:hypothetical protein
MNCRSSKDSAWVSVAVILVVQLCFSFTAESAPQVRSPLIVTTSGPILGIQAPDGNMEAFLGYRSSSQDGTCSIACGTACDPC